jgi:hypothetical protein
MEYGRLRAAFCFWRCQKNTIMRRVIWGSLVVAALASGGNTFAIEAGPAAGTAPAGKQAASPKPKKPPLPLSDAAARDAARANELPAASGRTGQSPSSSQPSWTGTYVGVGTGTGVGK